MNKLNLSYFDNEEVVLVGLSSNKKSYSQMVYKSMIEQGVTVYPVNNRKDATFGINVFESIIEVPRTATIACVLTRKEHNEGMVEQIITMGIKKILIRSKSQLSEKDIEAINREKIEVTIGCPNMVLGKGLHRFHGYLAGVK